VRCEAISSPVSWLSPFFRFCFSHFIIPSKASFAPRCQVLPVFSPPKLDFASPLIAVTPYFSFNALSFNSHPLFSFSLSAFFFPHVRSVALSLFLLAHVASRCCPFHPLAFPRGSSEAYLFIVSDFPGAYTGSFLKLSLPPPVRLDWTTSLEVYPLARRRH